jgi:hypothetical protein
MKTKLYRLCAFSSLLFLSPMLVNVYGQAASTGAILGIVLDPSGGAVPNAEVKITNVLTGVVRSSRTNGSGEYDFEALPAEGTTYDVTITREGFKTSTTASAILHPSERLSVNATLQIGASSSQVTVEAAAVHVETTTGESAGTIMGDEVQELQLNGRDFRGLALLIPGVNSTSSGGNAVGGGGALPGGGLTGESPISVNGLGREMNNYTTDGGYNNNTGNMINLNVVQPVQSIAEFRILKDNYSAKYGTAGGAEIEVATKSGTRKFHGSGYDFLRNDALDARNFFSPSAPILKQNIFGGDIGGPVVIPHLYNTDKSKTFFYVNVELRRRNVNAVARGAMIPGDMRNGDFTNSPTLGTGGLSLGAAPTQILAQEHPGVNCVVNSTHLNPACFDPNAMLIMNKLWPLPNNPAGGFNNYINTGTERFDGEDHTYRIDHNFSEKYRLLARSSYENIRDEPPYLAWGSNPAPTTKQKIKTTGWNNFLNFTATINPTTINQVSITQTDDKPQLTATGIFLSDIPGLKIQLPYGIADPSKRMPEISIASGWAGNGESPFPLYASDGEFVYSDDFTKIKGGHTIQAGTMFISGVKRQSQTAEAQGSFNFSGVHTNDPAADFLLGLDSSFTQTNARLRGYYHYHQSESYLQDDWRVNHRLTLNIGARVVYFSSDKMEGNGFTDFNPKLYNASQAPVVNPDGTLRVNSAGLPVTASGGTASLLNGIVFAGKNGVPAGIFTTSPHIAPRIGFAWDIFGDGKTSLRGGYGVGYGRIPFAIFNNDLGNAPYTQQVNLLNGSLTDPSLGTPSALTTQGLGTVGSPGATYNPVKIQTWSLTVQREIMQNAVLSVAYVGSHGSNIPGSQDLNFPLPVSGPSLSNPDCLQPGQTIPSGGFQFDPCLNRGLLSADYTRPYRGWSGIGAASNSAGQYNGVSNYDSLQSGFNYRASSSLTLSAAYTYGHALSDVASRGIDSRQTGNGAQNPRNWGAEYGSPGYDRRHIFTSSYIWKIPFLRHRTDLMGKALGNWAFSGMTTIESGFVLTPGLSTSTNGLAGRPNCIAPVTALKKPGEWFETSAFAAPAFGFFGNCGTGIIQGPGEQSWNWALYKTFPLYENTKLEFRSEFFNVWNHPNFVGVSTGLGSGDFGQVTSALDPRQIEFSLKLSF